MSTIKLDPESHSPQAEKKYTISERKQKMEETKIHVQRGAEQQ